MALELVLKEPGRRGERGFRVVKRVRKLYGFRRVVEGRFDDEDHEIRQILATHPLTREMARERWGETGEGAKEEIRIQLPDEPIRETGETDSSPKGETENSGAIDPNPIDEDKNPIDEDPIKAEEKEEIEKEEKKEEIEREKEKEEIEKKEEKEESSPAESQPEASSSASPPIQPSSPSEAPPTQSPIHSEIPQLPDPPSTEPSTEPIAEPSTEPIAEPSSPPSPASSALVSFPVCSNKHATTLNPRISS